MPSANYPVVQHDATNAKSILMAVGKRSVEEMMKSYREWTLRCPRLGGEVPFSYCEREAGDLPCRQVVRCWETGFPVEKYLRETLMPDAWERFCGQVPKDRMTMILDIVEVAKKRKK
jgi:hypothetical protein